MKKQLIVLTSLLLQIFIMVTAVFGEFGPGSIRRLTNQEGANYPSFTPDGTKIVYQEGYQICKIKTNNYR